MSDLIPWHAPYAGWTVLAVLALVGGWLILRGVRRRRVNADPDRCARCGYDLRFSPTNVCSECGHSRDVDSAAFERRWRLVIVGSVVAFGLPVYVAQGRIRAFGWRYYTCIGPLYWLLPDETVEQVTFGRVNVAITVDRRVALPSYYASRKLIVRDSGRVIFHDESDHGNLGWDSFDTVATNAVKLPSLFDLDGDGVPEAIAQLTPGGNSGDSFLYVISLGDYPCFWRCVPRNDRPSTPNMIEHGQLLDHLYRDADGTLLGCVLDHSFVFFHTSHAGSAYPRAILQFNHGKVEVAVDRMRAPLPSPEQLQACIDDCLAAKDVQVSALQDDAFFSPLIAQMVDLIYSGHSAEAYQLLDRAWPGSDMGKLAFKRDFQGRLQQSQFWPAIVALGHPPV